MVGTSDGPPDDLFVLCGDAGFILFYGGVQGVVDMAFTPLASSNPELFIVTEPLPAPLQQGAVLAVAWVATCKALDGYRPELTRQPELNAALTSCLATWAISSACMLGVVLLLQTQLGLGPGLREDELSFVTGSLTIVGAWRLLCAVALPSCRTADARRFPRRPPLASATPGAPGARRVLCRRERWACAARV